MRVLLVAPQPFYRDRGTPIAVRQVLEALSELGHEVDLLTFPTGEDVDLPGLEIVRVGGTAQQEDAPIGFSGRKVRLDLHLTSAARKRLARREYDVVHAVEEAAFPLTVLAGRRGVPLIYDMQSSLPEQLETHAVLGRRCFQPALRGAERWLVRRSDAIGCSCGLRTRVEKIAPRAEVHEWLFIPDQRRADAEEVGELRRSLGIPEDAPVVLYTGNFAEYQGVPLLLEAAERVHHQLPEAVFLLVGGEREDLPREASHIDALVRRGALHLVARQPRETMHRYVALADVLVSPRKRGGNLPLKIFDYLQAGKPIVATDSATHRTVLDDDRALLVPMSAQDLGASITMILRQPERAMALGLAARAWAKAHLGQESFRNRVARLYDAALERGRRRRDRQVMDSK